ncbi:hypothetical protein HanRHA438_Chr15g0694471 [Helianthus annuus]|nr:hypothetical protein HanIR_Chr17g0850991 [Helianthus annuus]KAJ0843721.1 hypothetical protein HanRHA438_Chr15g0694471 [Helianthus annuus]
MALSSSRGLTDPLTEDESMSLSSSRGWPSSAYFIQGYILGAGKSYYAATLLGLIAHMSFFSDALEAFGGGQHDPVSSSIGGLLMLSFVGGRFVIASDGVWVPYLQKRLESAVVAVARQIVNPKGLRDGTTCMMIFYMKKR